MGLSPSPLFFSLAFEVDCKKRMLTYIYIYIYLHFYLSGMVSLRRYTLEPPLPQPP
jgi:hypothetical protein